MLMLRGWVWVQESDGLGEETPPESLSFCHQAAEALTRWQQSEKTALLSNIQRRSIRKQLFLFEISQQKCRPRMFTGGLNATVLGLVCSLCLGILGCFSPCGFSAGKHWLYSSMHIIFFFFLAVSIRKAFIGLISQKMWVILWMILAQYWLFVQPMAEGYSGNLFENDYFCSSF